MTMATHYLVENSDVEAVEAGTLAHYLVRNATNPLVETLVHRATAITRHPELLPADVFMICTYAYGAVQLELVDSRSVPLETQIKKDFGKVCSYYLKCSAFRREGEFGYDEMSYTTAAHLEADPVLYHRHKIRKAFFHEVKQQAYGLFHLYLRYGVISKMPELKYDEDNQISIVPEVYCPNFNPISFARRRPPRDVCWPGDKKPVIEKEPQDDFAFTMLDVKRFGKPINFAEPGSNLAAHHIISLNLLNRFFEIHAELKKVDRSSSACPQIDNRFYNILNFSQRKLLTIKLWWMYTKSDPRTCLHTSAPPELPSNAQMDDVEKFIDHLGRVYSWSTGANLFVGPLAQHRGPFDPSKRGLEFEFDAKEILGEVKFGACLELYQQIDQFLKLEKSKVTLDASNNIYDAIFKFYLLFEITPYNEEQWEKRTPTLDELNSLPKSLAKKSRGKEFWAIKREDSQSSTSIRKSCTSTEDHDPAINSSVAGLHDDTLEKSFNNMILTDHIEEARETRRI